MICYRDRTFCPFFEYCEDGDTCERALKPDVYEAAHSINLPISSFVAPPIDCFKHKLNEENKSSST